MVATGPAGVTEVVGINAASTPAGPEQVEITVGVIGRPHGIRGDVSVQPRTDEPERRFAVGSRLRSEDGRRTLTVETFRLQQGRLVVRFAELADRTAAEAARGIVLVTEVPQDEQPTDDGEYYDRQLVGLSALLEDGSPVGTVRQVLHLPTQDTLEIATASGPRLVPFVAELVPDVDLVAGTLTVRAVPGLLEDLAEDATGG